MTLWPRSQHSSPDLKSQDPTSHTQPLICHNNIATAITTLMLATAIWHSSLDPNPNSYITPHTFNVRACVRAGVRACVCASMRAGMHACMRACVHACVHACVRACVRARVRACVRPCVRPCVRMCVRVIFENVYKCKPGNLNTHQETMQYVISDFYKYIYTYIYTAL
jgi:hypothetical protein